jgi:hypothetical protein
MGKDKNNLESPSAPYGRIVRVGDLQFEPVDNLDESLRAQGYITLEDFKNKYSNRM